MVRDVDTISRRFDPLISVYIRTALVLSDTDRRNRPDSYTTSLCGRTKAADCLPRLYSALVETPILTTKAVFTYRAVIPANIQLIDTTPVTHVLSVYVLLYSHLP